MIMPKFLRDSLFRWLLGTRKLSKWHAYVTAPGKLLGADVNEEKLWSEFKRALKWHCRVRINRYWKSTKTIPLSPRIRMLKPVKPAKKFIITLTNLPASAAATERCIKSAQQYGEDDDLEIMPAIDKFQALDFFTQHGLTWNARATGHNSLAGMGCFSSHFKLWLRCIELDEPIIVLEHDAIFRASLPALKFKHVIVLGRPTYDSLLHIVEGINPSPRRAISQPWEALAGTHAYAIKPAGARKLVTAASRELLLPADHFMCKSHIDILYFHPYPVDLDIHFSTIANHCAVGPSNEEAWKNYKPTHRPTNS